MSTLKDIVVGNDQNEYQLTSAEELMSDRKNSWVGWKCSAGVDNIHITPDGNIFAATCKIGGLLGNVFDTGVLLPKHWVVCNKQWCMCGSDMKLAKVKDKVAIDLKPDLFKTSVNEMVNPTVIGNAYFHNLRDFPKNVSWDLGRRCNYSCSYCPPSTANNFEAHKSWGSLKQAADLILQEFCGDKKAKWVFTGGEPTINPNYLTLVKYLRENHQIIHTQTNGSRTPEYFSELIELSSIGFSIHFEEANLDRVIDNVKAIIEMKRTSQQAKLQWMGIRLMVAPGMFDKAFGLLNHLRLIDGFDDLCTVNMSTVYKKENGEQLMDYAQDELQKILQHA